jgi:hypothetical protein
VLARTLCRAYRDLQTEASIMELYQESHHESSLERPLTSTLAPGLLQQHLLNERKPRDVMNSASALLLCSVTPPSQKPVGFYAEQPDPLEFAEPLSDVDEHRFRVGVYCIRFEVLSNLICVVSVNRCDEAYQLSG